MQEALPRERIFIKDQRYRQINDDGDNNVAFDLGLI